MHCIALQNSPAGGLDGGVICLLTYKNDGDFGSHFEDCGVRLVREVRLGGEGIWLEKGKCSEEFEMWSV
jgi:hypothetical protein